MTCQVVYKNVLMYATTLGRVPFFTKVRIEIGPKIIERWVLSKNVYIDLL